MQLVLVDKDDHVVGSMEKMEVHQKGLLHRAFSVFIFNTKGEMLLQQRAAKKYHSPNLWANACCSHPLAEEKVSDAASRRLMEELGFSTALQPAFHFIYKEDVGDGLTEHEYDHVFSGTYEGTILPNADEVQDYCFMTMDAIEAAIASHPHKYTSWFKIAFPKMQAHLSHA